VDFISPNKFEGTLQSIRQVNRDINQEIQHEDDDFRYVTLGDIPVPQIEEENTRALLNSKNSDES